MLGLVVLVMVSQVGAIGLWLTVPAVLAVRGQSWSRTRTLLVSAGLFVALHLVVIGAAVPLVAPAFGRVPLPCFATQRAPLRPASIGYCILARNYVRPELGDILTEASVRIASRHPGTLTTYLDASFPFVDGFPLLPHLSHDDGRRVDLAFFYRGRPSGEPVLRGTPSPIGYWAYEQPLPGERQPCRGKKSALRWDLGWLQPLFGGMELDTERTRLLLKTLVEAKRVKKVLIEPHLKRRMGLKDGRIQFQGCRAARHDDHIHVQIR